MTGIREEHEQWKKARIEEEEAQDLARTGARGTERQSGSVGMRLRWVVEGRG